MGRGRCIALALGLAGCGGTTGGPALGLLEFHQAGLDSVALNEDLRFYFDADLDRASISSDSVRILDERGLDVPGERSVRKRALTFRPTLPRASDLSDGGLRPGERYRVVLGGFPRPDGVRSESGALLPATLLFSFRTAAIGENPLFLRPAASERIPVLKALGRRVAAGLELEGGVLELECSEALDPSSVPGAHFELKRAQPGTRELEEVPLAVHLAENRPEHALLALQRSDGQPLAPGEYYLYMPELDLRTLGGRVVEPAWGPRAKLIVPHARAELVLAADLRTGEVPPGCDGIATWSKTGAGVRLRFPAAAGDGRDGVLELAGALDRRDVNATRLSIQAGAELDLSALSGPVVLRSQTSLEVRGRLLRRGTAPRFDVITQHLVDVGEWPLERRPTLSTWLQELFDPTFPGAAVPCTILIAGGDIRVRPGAALETEGLLVLVAGGTVRVEGNNVVVQGDVWWQEKIERLASRGTRRVLPLELDEPALNPLRTRLVVGAVTRPFPWIQGSGAPRRVAALEAERQWSVEFQPSGDPGQVRAVIRLEMGPASGTPWDPPRIERLVLEGGAIPR